MRPLMEMNPEEKKMAGMGFDAIFKENKESDDKEDDCEDEEDDKGPTE